MKKKKLSLTTIIFIALLLGAVTGISFNLWVPAGFVRDQIFVEGIFYVCGQGFIRLMQMLVVPLVFCSLVCGSMAIGDTKHLGKVGVKTMVFYLLTTAIAVSVAIFIAFCINPGEGLNMGTMETAETVAVEKTSVADTLLNIIPTNPIAALANGEMLPLILFALIVGVILAHRGRESRYGCQFFQPV